ncbi:hypothetical protein OIO01_11790, partial [Staphylococcus aureus]|nr:hypothetical protein [Staphylococcus aureus]
MNYIKRTIILLILFVVVSPIKVKSRLLCKMLYNVFT